MEKVRNITQTVLKAVALAMAVASMVLGYLSAIETATQVGLLSLGLFALAVAALQTSNK